MVMTRKDEIEIVSKLDTIISQLDVIVSRLEDVLTLLGIATQESINRIISEIKSDEAMVKILQIIEEKQPISFSELLNESVMTTGLKHAAIKIRLSKLKNLGLVRTYREGKRVFYKLSNLISI